MKKRIQYIIISKENESDCGPKVNAFAFFLNIKYFKLSIARIRESIEVMMRDPKKICIIEPKYKQYQFRENNDVSMLIIHDKEYLLTDIIKTLCPKVKFIFDGENLKGVKL